MHRAAVAGRLGQVGRELRALRMPAGRDQAVGGRPNHEGCGPPRGRDDPADPLTGRLVSGVCAPPGGAVGDAVGAGEGRLLAVLVVPPEEAEPADAVTPSTACGQEFPYAVPCPATQSQGGNLSPGLTSGNRFGTASPPANTKKSRLASTWPSRATDRPVSPKGLLR